MEIQPPDRPPPTTAAPLLRAAMARTTKPLGAILHHARKRGDAGREAETFEAVPNCLAGRFHHRVVSGLGVVIVFFMALLSFVDSSPRAYRLKASNAAPSISTARGTCHCPVASRAGALSLIAVLRFAFSAFLLRRSCSLMILFRSVSFSLTRLQTRPIEF